MKADRRLITGHLDSRTPWCVLSEIALAHSIRFEESRRGDPIYHSKVIVNIHYTETPTIPVEPSTWTTADLRKIVKFVNPTEGINWPRQNLEDAFMFLLQYTEDYQIPSQSAVGLQTPEHPRRLNASIVYRLLRREGVAVPIETTLAEMWDILMTTRLPRIYLASQLRNSLDKYTNGQLVSTLIEAGVEYRPRALPTISNESFAKVPVKFSLEQAQLDPILAVAFAAQHGYNLKLLKFPTIEVSGITRTSFVPVSEHVRNKLNNDPYAFSLAHHFDPNIPPRYYTTPILAQACAVYGHDSVSGNANTYNLLCELILSNNFYHGRLATISNIETITGETVTEVPDTNLICYGVRDVSVVAMTYDELFAHFNAVGMPTNPFVRSNEPRFFTESQLKRLMILATLYQKHGVRERIMGYLSQDVLDQHILAFKNVRLQDKVLRDKFDEVMVFLRNVFLYGRGWDGSSTLPIAEAGPHTYKIQASDLTFQSIRTLQDLDSKFNAQTGLSILNFPLLRYDTVTHVYNKVMSEEDGKTIGGRLEIILYSDHRVAGKEHHFENIKGCIRTSSNYLGWTYHYIVTRLGLDPGFNIADFRYLP